jgi:hypothetical protein
VSGADMTELHRLALDEGVPVQSLIASVVHQFVNGLLVKPEMDVAPPLARREGDLAAGARNNARSSNKKPD